MPQFLLGNAGMPRRYYSYPDRYQWLHVLSTAGASILALSLAITVGYLAVALFRGQRTADNPWDSLSYEWQTTSPPPPHNDIENPDFERGPYDYPVEEAWP